MSAIEMQRDLVITLKKETFFNVGILSKLYPLSVDLTCQVFKENALEKLTQNVFNHLSYYLVSIIDPQASATLPWPLYDTKTERAYRNRVSAFFSDYSSKGLLSPVMSSYLVNPGCYKVTVLMFQLSQLAVQRALVLKMKKDHQKSLYKDTTEKYKSQIADGFIDRIEAETKTMLSKLSNYLRKREAIEKIAEMIRRRITEMEGKLMSLKAQEYINNLVDTFVKENELDKESNLIILQIKNVREHSVFFDSWLTSIDKQMVDLEAEWECKMLPFFDSCKRAAENTEALIARQTGEADKSSFTVEYNPSTDEICTRDLENQVNSQQKYILKNITNNGRLNFPNLIRGFLVAISCILKNAEIGDEIYTFNEYLDGGRRNYKEILSSMSMLLERVKIAEGRLQSTPTSFNQSISMRELSEIPPLPDLSDLKMNREYHSQFLFDTFTPLNVTKYQFNLNRKAAFTKPLPKSLLVTPFHHRPNGNILNSLTACCVSSYDRPNITHNLNDISILSQASNRVNETIADCHAGFTKQQICRLLSTKKKSSTKKIQFKTHRLSNNVKKGNLFNDSNFSNESFALTRSHSSPNLFEDREKRSHTTARSRKLSIMKEDSPSLLEVSGIAALERDCSHSTPQGVVGLESCRKLTDSSSMPIITPPDSSQSINKVDHILNDIDIDLNKEIESIEIQAEAKPVVSWKENVEELRHLEIKEERVETPKTNTTLIRKTSSLEKIINRFKKVRASVLPSDMRDEEIKDLKNIAEEKDNLNLLNDEDEISANRILLPDLLSPSCSVFVQNTNGYLDQLDLDFDDEKPGKSRFSLGAALGVDHTFLDQFELID